MNRTRRLGDAALTIEFGGGVDAALAARVRGFDAALRERPPRGYLESVPGFGSLMVVFDPSATSPEDLEGELAERSAAPLPVTPPARRHVVPVTYGGEFGPDLDFVARSVGASSSQLVDWHVSREYTVFMLGFAPGFGYLGSLDGRLRLPRRATPRPRVAAGSVGIAGALTAVYPFASAGGWQLLGRTLLSFFDPGRAEPARLSPGDHVSLRSVPWDAQPKLEPAAPVSGPARPALEVLEGGLLTTVQDLGRPRYRRHGVSVGGAADSEALVVANRAVGNPDAAAVLECTIQGPTLRVLTSLRLAVAGADLGAALERADLGLWPVPLGERILARAGNVLRFTGRRSGCRAVLAVEGGIEVPLVLGSRSTHLAAGFGGFAGRAVRAGDVLGAGPSTAPPRANPARSAEAKRTVAVKIVLGPQADHFAPEALRSLLQNAWRATLDSDRVALRLEGPRLAHCGPAEILPEGMVPGAIQVPPDGQPIVMLVDAPTTGGYPKIATVVHGDLPALAQLAPGEGRVRFAVA